VGRPWTIASAPAAARVALNAGQFTDDGPWGWVVHNGRELRPPGDGPLAMAVVVDSLAAVRVVEADRVAEVRARGGIVEAFQSYPALLVGDGEVPLPLREGGRGVDLEHRDARLAIGELRDGRLLLALTRFDALGGKLSELPFGPTVPEMAAIMGALGCARAVALDGGISGQLLVREPAGRTRTWSGLRAVPLGLAVLPRGAP
jgi:exopolysaccharide biosynthesis protein